MNLLYKKHQQRWLKSLEDNDDSEPNRSKSKDR